MPAVNAQFPAPLQCLFHPKRFKVLWGGRGAGRSWGVARALLLIGVQRPIRVLCVRELQNSLDESVHKLLSDQIDALGLGTLYRIEKAHIYGQGGTMFSFEGIKNNTTKIKSYEGIDYCWVEEANKVSRSSWGVLTPTIRKETPADWRARGMTKPDFQSEIWLTFNPELETDYTYQRFTKDPDLRQVAVDRFAEPVACPIYESDSMFAVKMSYRDNEWFPEVLRSEMEEDKRKDYDRYLNVWEGNCVQLLEGTVYAKEIRRATAESRICTVPYDRSVPVNVFFDLGRADNTAIWFVQRVAMQYRMLSYYEASGFDIDHYLQEMQTRGYVYDTVYLPHDAKAKRLGSKRSIEEIVRAAGYRVSIVAKQSLVDGINAARIIFPSCWFDERECAEGLLALRNYRYRVVDGQLSNEPLHDWASDGADAFRYFAVGIREPRGTADRLKAALARAVGSPAPAPYAGEGRPTAGLGWMR